MQRRTDPANLPALPRPPHDYTAPAGRGNEAPTRKSRSQHVRLDTRHASDPLELLPTQASASTQTPQVDGDGDENAATEQQ
jgi:hypothetical protein